MANDYKDGESYVNNRVMERTCRDTKVFAATSPMVHQLREKDFFKPDVLVFDECSQAIEPALLAAYMKGIKQLIISGDPRQLGPVVHSTRTSPLGKQLSVSPMDRLPLAYPHMPLVQLVNNYRGHPETIDICSYMIYDDLMKPGIVPWPCRDGSTGAKVAAFMATGGTNDMFQRSIDYKQSGRVWFVDTVNGKTEREPGGTSWKNQKGINVIVAMSQSLVRATIKPEKIVIITMYSYDKKEMRSCLREANLNIEVCTIDSFQGHERDIVFVHFPANHEDGKSPWGFTSNDRRVNVAVSRTKEMMYIVGNYTSWHQNENRLGDRDYAVKRMLQWLRKHELIVEWV